jgi:hypothetical protein
MRHLHDAVEELLVEFEVDPIFVGEVTDFIEGLKEEDFDRESDETEEYADGFQILEEDE